jgi:hypothetical protein
MKISIKQARDLYNALVTVTSGNRSVATKLANGDNTVTQIPYELEDKARWNLIKNLSLIERLLKDADKNRDSIITEITGGLDREIRKADDPEKFSLFIKRAEEIESVEESIPLLRVKLSGLKVNVNAIAGVVVSALMPILEQDIPAPDASEIIPD